MFVVLHLDMVLLSASKGPRLHGAAGADETHEKFLTEAMGAFRVWRLGDGVLPSDMVNVRAKVYMLELRTAPPSQ